MRSSAARSGPKTLTEAGVDLAHELRLRQAGPPLRRGPQVGVDLEVEKPGGIGAVVRSPELGVHRCHLGKGPEHGPRPSGDLGAGLERYAERHGRARPDVAFLELRQELSAEVGEERQHPDDERQRCLCVAEHQHEEAMVEAADRLPHDVAALADLPPEQVAAEHR